MKCLHSKEQTRKSTDFSSYFVLSMGLSHGGPLTIVVALQPQTCDLTRILEHLSHEHQWEYLEVDWNHEDLTQTYLDIL